MPSFADAIELQIRTALKGSSTKRELIELGSALQPGMSKEEYLEFTKRMVKEYTDDLRDTLEDAL